MTVIPPNLRIHLISMVEDSPISIVFVNTNNSIKTREASYLRCHQDVWWSCTTNINRMSVSLKWVFFSCNMINIESENIPLSQVNSFGVSNLTQTVSICPNPFSKAMLALFEPYSVTLLYHHDMSVSIIPFGHGFRVILPFSSRFVQRRFMYIKSIWNARYCFL